MHRSHSYLGFISNQASLAKTKSIYHLEEFISGKNENLLQTLK